VLGILSQKAYVMEVGLALLRVVVDLDLLMVTVDEQRVLPLVHWASRDVMETLNQKALLRVLVGLLMVQWDSLPWVER